MGERIYNFYPGPAILPLPVLKQVQEELLDYRGSGMSVMEMSHRSSPIEELIDETESLFKNILAIPDNYRVLFLQGGASTQFYLIPFNYLRDGLSADYIVTGSFAEKAYQEAAKVGGARIAATNKENGFKQLPGCAELDLDPGAAYVHVTSNNTVYGTQWHDFSGLGDASLFCDASSDILSRNLDIEKFALLYGGAQKNLGPSGVTVLIVRQDILEKCNPDLPQMMRYDIHAQKKSLYNTPPTLAIYIVNLVLKWIKSSGGLYELEERNGQKAKQIYDAIDESDGFYRGYAAKECRSLMNITFHLPNAELEEEFIDEAAKQRLVGLKGYRSLGGIRASIYNAMPLEGCEALAAFMRDFQKRNR